MPVPTAVQTEARRVLDTYLTDDTEDYERIELTVRPATVTEADGREGCWMVAVEITDAANGQINDGHQILSAEGELVEFVADGVRQ